MVLRRMNRKKKCFGVVVIVVLQDLWETVVPQLYKIVTINQKKHVHLVVFVVVSS